MSGMDHRWNCGSTVWSSCPSFFKKPLIHSSSMSPRHMDEVPKKRGSKFARRSQIIAIQCNYLISMQLYDPILSQSFNGHLQESGDLYKCKLFLKMWVCKTYDSNWFDWWVFMSHVLRKWGASEYAGFLACPIGFVLVQYVIFIAKLGRAIDEKKSTFWWLEQTFAQEVAMLSGKWADWHATFHEVR